MQVQNAITTKRPSVAFLSGGHNHNVKQKAKKVVEQVNRVNLRTLIVSQSGRFCSVDYVKNCGEQRTLTGRLGVKAYLKGGSNNVERLERPYLTMFDINLRQYRTVSLDTVYAIRAGGVVYNVID